MGLLDKSVLEGYNLRVIRQFARRHLPQPGRNNGLPPRERTKAFEHWKYLIYVGAKYKLIEELPGVTESMKVELDELQQKDILREMKETIPRRGQGLTEARRRSHRKYQHEVMSPRRKATRHYMADNPELVAQIKEKHGLA